MDDVEAHFDSAFIPAGGSEVWLFVCSEELGVELSTGRDQDGV